MKERSYSYVKHICDYSFNCPGTYTDLIRLAKSVHEGTKKFNDEILFIKKHTGRNPGFDRVPRKRRRRFIRRRFIRRPILT